MTPSTVVILFYARKLKLLANCSTTHVKARMHAKGCSFVEKKRMQNDKWRARRERCICANVGGPRAVYERVQLLRHNRGREQMAPREYMQHTQRTHQAGRQAKQQEKLLPLLLLGNIKARGFIIQNKTLDWGGLCLSLSLSLCSKSSHYCRWQTPGLMELFLARAFVMCLCWNIIRWQRRPIRHVPRRDLCICTLTWLTSLPHDTLKITRGFSERAECVVCRCGWVANRSSQISSINTSRYAE
jgi:hypothetical protein